MKNESTTYRHFAARFQHFVVALALIGVYPSRALAQERHSHTQTPQHFPEQNSKASALIKVIRDSNERFKNV